MENFNRRLNIENNCRKYSFLDTTMQSDEEANFSFKDVKDKITGIFKKDVDPGSSSRNNNSGSVKEKSGIGIGIFSGLLGIVGSLAPVIPSLGIGSKSRIAEANAIAAANNSNTLLSMDAEMQKAKELKSMLLIVGVLIFVIVIAVVALRK